MAAESNHGFHYDQNFGGSLNRHAIPYQANAMDSTNKMIMRGNYYGLVNTAADMMFTGNSGIMNSNPGTNSSPNPSGSLLLDSVPGLKHDAGLAVEWSVEEQYKLEEGLVKYADEPSIMRYIKIGALLRDKTVRDVALRCRWMMRKRRKQDDRILGSKAKDRKDKLAESSSSKMNISSSASPSNMGAYPLINHRNQSDRVNFEVLCGTTRHLLEQNNQVLGQISSNLSTLKLQDNVDLFCRMRNNINTVLNDMTKMPGIMSQMPPLPLAINEDLVNTILPNSSQTMMFGSSSGIHMKQEPRC